MTSHVTLWVRLGQYMFFYVYRLFCRLEEKQHTFSIPVVLNYWLLEKLHAADMQFVL